MSKLKSLLIIIAVLFTVNVSVAFDGPILPPNDDSMGPILPPNDDARIILLADGDRPILPPNDDGMPILPPNDDAKMDIQLVDGPILPPNDDGIIFPNPVPPTTGSAFVSVA